MRKATIDFEKGYEKRLIDLLDLKKSPEKRKGNGEIRMRDPQGNLREVSKDQREEALKAGYKLVR